MFKGSLCEEAGRHIAQKRSQTLQVWEYSAVEGTRAAHCRGVLACDAVVWRGGLCGRMAHTVRHALLRRTC